MDTDLFRLLNTITNFLQAGAVLWCAIKASLILAQLRQANKRSK